MRVIGGRLRGRRLVAPKGFDTRPTTDRVRENLFNILQNRIMFDGARVLDLFAGSGAFGVEALSRGASFALFIEKSSPARAAIRQNLKTLDLESVTKLSHRDATKPGAIGCFKPFDLVFADPPYGKGLGEKAAESLIRGDWLADNAIFILEEQAVVIPRKIPRFDLVDMRVYGETAVGLFKYCHD